LLDQVADKKRLLAPFYFGVDCESAFGFRDVGDHDLGDDAEIAGGG